MAALRRIRVGTRAEVAIYAALAIALAIGALLLSDLVLGIGAGFAALALIGALVARRRDATEDGHGDR